MLESIGDYVSFLDMLFFSFMGFYYLFRVSSKHHEAQLRQMESEYYEDEDDSDSDDDPYSE